MLGMRGKAYVGKENMEQSGSDYDDVSQVHIFWFTAVQMVWGLAADANADNGAMINN